jgi:hypothetical protein
MLTLAVSAAAIAVISVPMKANAALIRTAGIFSACGSQNILLGGAYR